MSKKNIIKKKPEPMTLEQLGVKRYSPKGSVVGFLELEPFDYTNQYNMDCMNKGHNYYERLDFEFVDWKSTVRCVCYNKTMEQLLTEIHDKYSLLILSFIFRKSITSIQNKLQELGLARFLEASIPATQEELVSAEIKRDENKYMIIFHQTEKREVEEWYIRNSGFIDFDFSKTFVEPFDFGQYIKTYMQNKEYLMLFKIMVVFCNLFRIPYELRNEEDTLDICFVLDKAAISTTIKKLTGGKKHQISLD